jgi:hypothetical protein
MGGVHLVENMDQWLAIVKGEINSGGQKMLGTSYHMNG